MDVDLRDDLSCHRCQGPLLLVVRVPHSFVPTHDERVDGTRGVGLCPACDRDDPSAQGPLAYFALHETIEDETEVVSLIEEWAVRVAARMSEPPTEEEWPEDC